MNESTKTIGFVVVGLAAAVLAWASRPSLPVADSANTKLTVLFPEFKDPLAATSLDIVSYDEGTASLRPFKVALANNRWSIPSHDNYPTDAKDQLAKLATELIGLKVLEVPTDIPGEHATYGVVDPDSKNLKAGTTGVGTRVTVKGKDDKVLLNLVVGKEVPGREGLRYVRVVGQDPVYSVALKTDKLSTKFSDWIETNLLQLNAFDIKQIQINDYSIDMLARRYNQRGQLTLAYSDTGEPHWKLTEDKVFQNKKWVDGKMGPDEELNATVLDAMKDNLNNLKIVDVSKKPSGLSVNLRASGELASDNETVASLGEKGFYVLASQSDPNYYELLSNDGEFRVVMKDGVQYVLRFGQIAGSSDAHSKDKAKKDKDGKAKDEASGAGVNRYLFVMAEFNRDALPKPQLQPLPEEKPAAKADEKKADEKKADDKKVEDKKPEAKKPEDKKADDKAQADLKAERERIEKENKRKQDEYEQKIKDGEKRVQELNARFADWYYVIDDSVYQKIHLNRDKLIKKKEKKDAAGHDHADEPKKDGTPADFKELKASAPGKGDK
ncbi:MAG: DUF4340 domain-containing protein [Thermoguttaceae bacterium]